MPKCAHWEFPTAETPLSAWSQCSSLCLLRPKTLLVISFSLLTASHRGKYSIEQPVEKEDVRVFWWFVQADLFVLPVLAVSLESIFLEVNSLWATTSHPCTKVKNKCDTELGIDVELKYEMTALLGRTIIDLCFHGKTGSISAPVKLQPKTSLSKYLKCLTWESTKFNFPTM